MNAIRIILAVLVLSSVARGDGRETALDLNDRALAALAEGEFDEAVRLLGEARAYLPANDTLRKNLAGAHARRGLARARAGKEDEALEDFRWAVHHDPDRAAYRVNLALTLVSKKEFAEARKQFEQTLAVAPRNADALEHYGRLLYRENELAGAIRAFRTALEVDPEREDVRTALAKAIREHEVESGMERDTGAHFAITFDGESNDRVARGVMELLEDAYTTVGYELGHYPRERVQVILYTREQFRSATEARPWVGGLYDGKIRLPVRGRTGSEADLRRTIVHEYVHVVVRDLAPRCPIWINEGMAQMFEGRSLQASRLRVLAADRAGKLLSQKELMRPFSTMADPERVAVAYAQSHALAAHLAATVGNQAFGDFLGAMKRGLSADDAFAHAFHDGMANVLSSWREEIHQEAEATDRR